MFECMEIYENIYEGVVEFSLKQTNGGYANHAGNRRKTRGKADLPKSYFDVSGHNGNCKQRYVYPPSDISKLP